MAKQASARSRTQDSSTLFDQKPPRSPEARIHPIIIYPYTQPNDYSNLNKLYEFVGRIADQPERYVRPITVLNQQTYYNNAHYKFNAQWNEDFKKFLTDVVGKHSDITRAWCVDSCQMWLAGLGHAYDHHKSGEDVYWLIPGDFNYADAVGDSVLAELQRIPEAVMTRSQDLCVGEIEVKVNSSKQLIDTYGTYGLLYNWFPQEAQRIRLITDKPRTEFFAICHSFLREVLRQRWYAYEQTIVILLYGVFGAKRISAIRLGEISDLEQGRDTLAAAMQQVERTERVLKLFYRERYEQQADWIETFRKLDTQSAQIRGAALVILQNLLSQ
jgi:hypothetical protein